RQRAHRAAAAQCQSDARALRQYGRESGADRGRRVQTGRGAQTAVMNTEDLQALRGPLILLVLVIAAAAGAVYYTHTLQQQAQAALMRQQGQLREAQTRMQRSGDEKTIIVQYVDQYRGLQQSGFIGDEQRFNWLDALRAANARTDLFGVN